jgi:hypothetical protein
MERISWLPGIKLPDWIALADALKQPVPCGLIAAVQEPTSLDGAVGGSGNSEIDIGSGGGGGGTVLVAQAPVFAYPNTIRPRHSPMYWRLFRILDSRCDRRSIMVRFLYLSVIALLTAWRS